VFQSKFLVWVKTIEYNSLETYYLKKSIGRQGKNNVSEQFQQNFCIERSTHLRSELLAVP